jgi:hypothetical protein
MPFFAGKMSSFEYTFPMDSTVLNVIALAISLLALLVSSVLAFRQTQVQRQANHALVMDLIREGRQRDWHVAYDYVCTSLPAIHEPNCGVSGLPEEAQGHFYNVAYYYHSFALMVALGVLDERQVIWLFRHRVITVWRSIQPYVERERAANANVPGNWLRTLEEFAIHLESSTPKGGPAPLFKRRSVGHLRRILR